MMHGFGFFTGMGFGQWLVPLVLVIVVGVFVRRLFAPDRTHEHRTGPQRKVDVQTQPDSLQTQIYRLAQKYGGQLTVSDVVIELGVEASTVETTLQEMSDGVRVRMDVDDQGLMTYQFLELINRQKQEKTKKSD